ncbi:MAG: dephospho-CoA kinase [Sulfobacillus benefaciens]|uniref:Dephospho-CoA kinase n=1 Tax=Sulfobacillus benefaciens TaxID=453960 RepID=A0A2T2XLM7_9FIRM|nr:MAG: dephospho-CoA kinase [Sulfobacillus benefaciens]
MRVIGLTGGIGSGKSQVSAILKDLGVPVIDADALTHACQTRGQPVWAAIWQQFGWSILGPNGEILRRKLGFLVFHDEDARKKLNQLVHPSVRALMAQGLDVFRRQGQLLAVLDVPLLIEGGLHKMVDEVWVVYADLTQQLSRIMERDHVDVTEAERRIGAQMPLDQKLSYAQVVIDNRGTLDELKDVVTQLWHKAQDRAKPDDG